MKLFLLTSFLISLGLHAQSSTNRIPSADRETTSAQADDIFKALRKVGSAAKQVVYPIYVDRERIGYGISLGDGQLLAKASEVMDEQGLFTANRAKEALPVKMIGSYPEHDLAILAVPGLDAVAAEWADASSLNEGAFLTAVKPDGEAQAMGVLSVKARSLRSEDQGYLGVSLVSSEDLNGVEVTEVMDGSAAGEAGILKGDIITKIGGKEVRGKYELATQLRRLKNGQKPEILLLRDDKVVKVMPTLQGRSAQSRRSRRLDIMDRSSGSRSRVRGEFENVIQSDMELESTDAGLPVVDLDGRIVGMVIARAGRISTLILPGDEISEILREEVTPHVKKAQSGKRRK